MSLLSIRQVSERLQISEYTICNWLRIGRLRGIKVTGNRWRVTEEAFQEFLKKNENEVEPDESPSISK